jgi:ribulose-phosphate 3-epimerase
MLADPLPELDDWLVFCELVVVHASSPSATEALARIAAAGVRGALAFSPGETLDSVPDVDALVMSVEPGHGGSLFLPGTLPRIAELASRHDRVGVDGGVTAERAADARAAGATWIVSGTALLADPAAFLA